MTSAETAAYARGLRHAASLLTMSNQTIRLHAGELSPDEMRCVQAVLKWKWAELEGLVEMGGVDEP